MEGSAKRAREQIVSDFKKHINLTQAIFLQAVGLDIIEDKRSGVYFQDIGRDGKYIDCFCSAGSFNVGRLNPEINAALNAALDEADCGDSIFVTPEKAALAELLTSIAPDGLNHVFFCSGGGEAGETALKMARGVTGKPGVISLKNGYHGHTGFCLSAIGKAVYRDPFEPLMPNFSHEPVLNDLVSVERAISDDTAAIILELVQGEAGIYVANGEFLAGLRKLCDERGVLLIFDEVQTGFGRTGKMFCCQHFGVAPDIMTVAKSISGGLYPISSVLFNDKVSDFMEKNDGLIEASSGGSDVGCRVARAVIEHLIENDIPGNAAKMGEYIGSNLERLAAKNPRLIREVRRKGLMIGLEYTHDIMGPLMSFYLAGNGVFAVFSGNNHKVMRLMPPLVINKQEADALIAAVDKSMTSAQRAADIVKFAAKIPLVKQAIGVDEMQVAIIFVAKTLRKLTGKS